jgi:fibronectin type 3 domain-containing protein
VENALSYNIYRNDEFLENVMDTSYVDEGLISGTEYCYTVAAVGKDAESDKSAESCAIPLGDDPDEPGVNPEEPIELDIPANVKANAISVSSIVVTWDFVVNATSYNLYRDDELIKNVTATNYIDEDLKYNTEYCYSVIAIYDEIKSDKSENVCVKTLGESVEEMLSAFRIYPNPADDKLYIETLTQTLTQTVEIFDVYGRRHVSEVPSRQGDLTIDVTSLNSGIYFVKVVTSEGEVLKRFVKK